MKRIDYIERYEMATNTQYIIENGQVVRETKFKQCPYVFFGKLKYQTGAELAVEPVTAESIEIHKVRMDV